jgi:hypothetical protein
MALGSKGNGLPAGRPTRAAPTSWGVYRLRPGLPMVGVEILDRDHRERQPKGYTHHEVIAARVGRP